MSIPGLEERVWRYLPNFQAAEKAFGPSWRVLGAICDVETECGTSKLLDIPGPAGRGDGGHGHGLFQIDDRTWAHWLDSHNWRDPQTNIDKAATILKDNLSLFVGDLECAIAAFNAGPGKVRHALADLHAGPIGRRMALNAVTAGGDYLKRVLVRMNQLENFHPAVA